MRKFIVVAYDISSDRRIRKISDLMEELGIRKNYSVFECFISVKQVGEMKKKIRKILKKKNDTVLIYYLCRDCIEKREQIGGIQGNEKVVRIV